MPTLTANGPFTVRMDFEVAEGRQQEMIQGVTDVVQREIAGNPGFIFSAFHASEDGRHVMNYAQWTSRAAWEAGARPDTPAADAIREVIARCGGQRLGVDVLTVTRIVEHRPAPSGAPIPA